MNTYEGETKSRALFRSFLKLKAKSDLLEITKNLPQRVIYKQQTIFSNNFKFLNVLFQYRL